MIEQIWRPVKDYEGLYEVNDCGQVRNIGKFDGRIRKPYINNKNVVMIDLYKAAQRTAYCVHRLVAFAFLGDPPTEKHEVNHKDGNRLNNHVGNLEWVTKSENILHSIYVLGNYPARGEEQANSKLTVEQVRKIRVMYAGGMDRVEVAKEFGICASHVRDIAVGKAWGWLAPLSEAEVPKPNRPKSIRVGEQHGRAKLTEEDVREIRQRHSSGGITFRALAKEFGVDDSMISLIVKRKSWRHVQ